MKALLDLRPVGVVSENLFDHPLALVQAPQDSLHTKVQNIANTMENERLSSPADELSLRDLKDKDRARKAMNDRCSPSVTAWPQIY